MRCLLAGGQPREVRRRYMMRRVIGLLFSAAVFCGAVFAFSPRLIPVFPATGLRVDTVLLLDAARAGKRLVAAGERGRIFLSDDEGATWRSAVSPTQATLTALYFLDARQGWAAGHDGVVLHSSDGGATWTQLRHAPEDERPLFSIRFEDPQRGTAAGAYGAYLESGDGGRSWTERKITDSDRHYNAMTVTESGMRLIAGESGTLLASTDGGANWKALQSPYKGSFFGLVSPGKSNLIAFGLRGNVYHSADLGGQWQSVQSPAQASLMGGRTLDPGAAVLVGQNGTVLLSRDGGETFTLHRDAAGAAFAAALPVANGDLLAFGERGVTRITGLGKP